MAGADVIEAAISITLLLIVSYVVIGSITAAAVTVSSAQNDITQKQLDRLGTFITVADYHYHSSYWDGSNTVWPIHFRVLNAGNQVIQHPEKMTVMLIHGSNPPVLLNLGSGSYGTSTWYYDGYFDIDISMTSDIINPGQWDPNEYLYGQFDVNFSPTSTDRLQVILPNGASAVTADAIYSS